MAFAFSCGMPWVSVISRRTVSFAAGVTAPSSRFFTGTLRLMSFDCSTSNRAFILKSSSATRLRTALARSIAFDRAKAVLSLVADDDFKMKALFDVLQSKLIKRNVPVKNLELGAVTPAANDTVRREITLTQGIPQEKAKAIVKAIKDKKFKKAQASIQGTEIRVQSPSKDELQEVMAFLRTQDWGIELKFGNYRG